MGPKSEERSRETLLLTRNDVAELFTLEEYIGAVEEAFRAYAEGRALVPGLLHVNGNGGGEFHIKAGGLTVAGRSYFGLKSNGSFFTNPAIGLPAIQGIIYVADGTTGAPLAVMDSIHITIQRTGAATAVAARHLARENASVVTVCGAGRQGRIQLTSLALVRPLTRAYVWDQVGTAATGFAEEMTRVLGFPVTAVGAPGESTRQSDIIVTCTPAKAPFLKAEDVAPGTFVAAIGADSPDKQELDSRILVGATVVTDVTSQCAHVGELHHAIRAGLLTEAGVHAEIGEIIAGKKPGRRTADEVSVYDATGTALQDTACAAAIYVKAMAEGRGTAIVLA